MKCPFRKHSITKNTEKGYTTITELTTDFQECYYGECPYYYPAITLPSGLGRPEECKRINAGYAGGVIYE